jgi:hypothetical protein
VTHALFVLLFVAVVLLIGIARPLPALSGFALVLGGLPVYDVFAKCGGRRPAPRRIPMTWIKTIPFSDAGGKLREAWEHERALYPAEYATPTGITDEAGSIVASHSLIPDALYHAFATFGVLMSPDLPLTRRQHEMITTVVSVTNRCFY